MSSAQNLGGQDIMSVISSVMDTNNILQKRIITLERELSELKSSIVTQNSNNTAQTPNENKQFPRVAVLCPNNDNLLEKCKYKIKNRFELWTNHKFVIDVIDLTIDDKTNSISEETLKSIKNEGPYDLGVYLLHLSDINADDAPEKHISVLKNNGIMNVIWSCIEICRPGNVPKHHTMSSNMGGLVGNRPFIILMYVDDQTGIPSICDQVIFAKSQFVGAINELSKIKKN